MFTGFATLYAENMILEATRNKFSMNYYPNICSPHSVKGHAIGITCDSAHTFYPPKIIPTTNVISTTAPAQGFVIIL